MTDLRKLRQNLEGARVEGRRGGPLSAAALQYDSAARELFGKTPAPTAAGKGLRDAGRLLLAAQVAKPSEIKQLLALMAQLAVLVDAVTRLRETQQRAARASASRRAAEQLRAATAHYSAENGRSDGAASTASGRTQPTAPSTVGVATPTTSRGPRR